MEKLELIVAGADAFAVKLIFEPQTEEVIPIHRPRGAVVLEVPIPENEGDRPQQEEPLPLWLHPDFAKELAYKLLDAVRELEEQ